MHCSAMEDIPGTYTIMGYLGFPYLGHLNPYLGHLKHPEHPPGFTPTNPATFPMGVCACVGIATLLQWHPLPVH